MMNGNTWQPATPYVNEYHNNYEAATSPQLVRQRFLFQVARIFQQNPAEIDRVLADLLAVSVTDPDFLHGMDLSGDAARYTRQQIFSNSEYSVLALIWRPGQMSPVHGHRAICALGVHAGTLTETTFDPAPNGIRLGGCRQLHPGDTSHGPADEQHAHRIANLGLETAISIHVYATPFDRLGTDLNHVWAS